MHIAVVSAKFSIKKPGPGPDYHNSGDKGTRMEETGKHGLKRELKLLDLVPMQVVLIVSLSWCGFAAKQGPSQVVLWLLAIFLFYLPLAAVVIKLSRALPVEGGGYQWIKSGISPFAGYMGGWNITVAAVIFFCTTGSQLANGFAYASGASGTWMLTSKPFAITLTALACLVALVVNVRGLHLAKWCSDAGALLTVSIFGVLLALVVRAFASGLPSAHHLAWPSFSIVTLSAEAKAGAN